MLTLRRLPFSVRYWSLRGLSTDLRWKLHVHVNWSTLPHNPGFSIPVVLGVDQNHCQSVQRLVILLVLGWMRSREEVWRWWTPMGTSTCTFWAPCWIMISTLLLSKTKSWSSLPAFFYLFLVVYYSKNWSATPL